MNSVRLIWISAVLLAGGESAFGADTPVTPTQKSPSGYASRANAVPRKVVIGSAVADFSGSLAVRLRFATQLLDAAAAEATKKYGGKGLDVMIFPEFALCHESGRTAAERAVPVAGPVLEVLGAKARELHTWIVIPMTLREEGDDGRISNAAVLLNRAGIVAGIFRKVHPVADEHGIFEGGVTPGESYPVFDCDFGRLGILICWDMAYEQAWDALATAGAELVALPSASPQTLRPAMQALRHHYYVVNSAPRDNASVFDPIGRTVAQTTTAPGAVVHEIDLSYAILHWSETLHAGRTLTERFGPKVGYSYSTREDTGVFWSNDPKLTIGEMIRELGLEEMPALIERMEQARKSAQKK